MNTTLNKYTYTTDKPLYHTLGCMWRTWITLLHALHKIKTIQIFSLKCIYSKCSRFRSTIASNFEWRSGWPRWYCYIGKWKRFFSLWARVICRIGTIRTASNRSKCSRGVITLNWIKLSIVRCKHNLFLNFLWKYILLDYKRWCFFFVQQSNTNAIRNVVISLRTGMSQSFLNK